MEKIKELAKYSNFDKAQDNAFNYLGDDAVLFYSPKPDKKYRIYDPLQNKWVDFGQMGYEDYTKHLDEERRNSYLRRTANMKGDWKTNKYSANNLSRNILW